MSAGDYRMPFFIMAACYLISTAMFWQFFAGKEKDLSLAPAEAALAGD